MVLRGANDSFVLSYRMHFGGSRRSLTGGCLGCYPIFELSFKFYKHVVLIVRVQDLAVKTSVEVPQAFLLGIAP